MKLIFQYMSRRIRRISLGMAVKILAAFLELLIPYVLEYIIDQLAPKGQAGPVIGWGLAMAGLAWAVRWGNIFANQSAVYVSQDCTREIRQDLFQRTVTLSGAQADQFGLPSLISRMTSDSYNVQNFITSSQTVGVRAPIMLVGGVCVALTMDLALASILCVLAPVMTAIVIFVSRKGIPLYDRVQREVDEMTRVMRENVTGARVVKALRKEPYEERRFQAVNGRLTRSDLTASAVMAIPAPAVQMFMNLGLILVVLVGAKRVDSGAAEPGVILAFLIYFNLILHSAMSFNRIFILLSKATASADRIAEVLAAPEDQPPLTLPEERRENGAFLEFDHVSFTYAGTQAAEKSLDGVSFRLNRGETLGIIGATGAGKSTVVRLLMRFYDAQEGAVYVDGQDVRTYEKKALREKFGAVFQNDVIFAESLKENITLGRPLTEEEVFRAAEDALAADFIAAKPGGYGYIAGIKGANLSGGQKQRLCIARALAARPEILILDDAASALDYRTDAKLRQALRERYEGVTAVIVAQRVSSVMGADKVLVLDEGRVIGCGTHRELLERCGVYRDIYQSQMGDLA
ncbi:MAG: ABC transporter ATP-binding protein/permease [Oscillospiraceae bacterium]|nr:ABC transporter ATP-binding protein/permease [Oscillospiraceae bacterium]